MNDVRELRSHRCTIWWEGDFGIFLGWLEGKFAIYTKARVPRSRRGGVHFESTRSSKNKFAEVAESATFVLNFSFSFEGCGHV